MERCRREKEKESRGKLMSSNDHIKMWQGKKMKSMGEKEGVKEKEKEKSKNEKYLKPESYRKKKNFTKSTKKNSFFLERKPILKSKLETFELNPDMKKNVKKEESVIFCWERRQEPQINKFSSFSSTWDHTNFSIVPSVNVNRERDFLRKEKKGKKAEKQKKSKFQSFQRGLTKKELPKSTIEAILSRKIQSSRNNFAYLPFPYFPKLNDKQMNEPESQAIVIFQRRNRQDYMNPDLSKEYRFEHISFTGSCQTTFDLAQSKRSLSEPRKKSLKEFYVARRKTRFHIDPGKVTQPQSDFISTLDFLKKKENTVEFKKFEGVRDDFNRSFFVNPIIECEKCDDENKFLGNSSQKQAILYKSKSSVDANTISEKVEVEKRLKQAAEKKLNLHKEMMRAEKMSRKRFWESIERSLNYRCALADMFSSQSFLSHNESAKFFSSTENSTEIFFRESIIEKISSYQGYHSFITPKANVRKNPSPKNLSQLSNSTYHQMKTMLESILIKEEEKENHRKNNIIKDNCFLQNSSQSSLPQKNENRTKIPKAASDKIALIESSLEDSTSELEFLMAKLSQEMKNCSQFIKKLHILDKDSDILPRKFSKTGSQEKEESGNKYHFMTHPIAVFPVQENVSGKDMDSADDKKKQAEDDSSSCSEENIDPKRTNKDHDLKTTNKENVSLSTKPFEESTASLHSFKSFGEAKKPKDGKGQRVTLARPKGKNTKSDICCEDCKHLKKRINKLEKDLERIERKIPLYPTEYQNTIQSYLEKLKATSETVLKRLKYCTKMKYDDLPKNKKKKAPASRRTASAPEPIVHSADRKKLFIRPSNSDFELNVGMEITMENIDPITGNKVHPDVSKNEEQEGNIRCKVVEDGKEPVMVLDTDFSYNPKTGMLFKNNYGSQHRLDSRDTTNVYLSFDEKSRSVPFSKELNEELRNSKQMLVEAYECSPFRNCPFKRNEEQVKKNQKNLAFYECPCQASNLKSTNFTSYQEENYSPLDCQEQNLKNEKAFTPKFLSCKINKPRSDEKIVQEKVREGKSKLRIPPPHKKKDLMGLTLVSRIPRRRKPPPSSSKSKLDCCASVKSSATSIYKSEGSYIADNFNVRAKSSSKKAEHAFKANQLFRKGSLRKKKEMQDKSIQTYSKKKITAEKGVAEMGVQTMICNKNFGIQVHVDTAPKGIQVCMSSIATFEAILGTHNLADRSQKLQSGSTASTNIGIQTNLHKEFQPMTHVGLQTNLPTEESLKYMNDLQVQKKVNMAIAELCFHLKKARENEGT